MPLTPMDMQVMLPRVQDINSAKQSRVNFVDNELAKAQQMNKDKDNLDPQMVHDLEQKLDHTVDQHDQQKNQNNSQSKKKQLDKEVEEEVSQLTGLGGKFDLKV